MQENPCRGNPGKGGDNPPPPYEPGFAPGSGAQPKPAEPPPEQPHGGAEPAEPAPNLAVAFQAFWQAYPENDGSQNAAQRQFVRKVSGGAEPERIIHAAKVFALTMKRERRFVPHAHNWLRDGRYNDPPPENNNAHGGTAPGRDGGSGGAEAAPSAPAASPVIIDHGTVQQMRHARRTARTNKPEWQKSMDEIVDDLLEDEGNGTNG
jgi:hypothetical protein